MAETKGGSWRLQGVGALLILGTFGAFARAEEVDLFFAGIGLLLIVSGFVLLYLGSKQAPVGRPLPALGAVATSPRLVGDRGAIQTVLAISARQCWGELYLTDTTLYFVCYADRMALGNAAPTIALRDQVRAQLRGAPLEQAITHSTYSRRFLLSEIGGFQKAFWTGQSFRAGGSRYQIVFGWSRAQRDQVRAWCAAHAVKCDGF